MVVGVKLGSLHLDMLKAILHQDFPKLLEDHLHALLEGIDVLGLGSHGPLEVVQQGQHVLQDALGHYGRELFLFLGGAAAKILKIRLQAKSTLFLFLHCRLQLL